MNTTHRKNCTPEKVGRSKKHFNNIPINTTSTKRKMDENEIGGGVKTLINVFNRSSNSTQHECGTAESPAKRRRGGSLTWQNKEGQCFVLCLTTIYILVIMLSLSMQSNVKWSSSLFINRERKYIFHKSSIISSSPTSKSSLVCGVAMVQWYTTVRGYIQSKEKTIINSVATINN